MIIRPLGLAFACLATVAVAQDIDPVRRDLLVEVITDSGCRMTEDQAEAILPAHDFTPDEVGPIAEALIAEGLAALEGDAFVLKTPGCA